MAIKMIRKPVRAKIQISWNASRFDKPPRTLVDMIARRAESGDSMIATDEVTSRARRAALDRAAEVTDMRLVQKRNGGGGLSEVAVLVDEAVWDILDWSSDELGPDMGPGDIVNGITLAARNLENDAVGVFSFAHLPSAVEGDWAERTARVLMYGRAAIKQRRLNRAMRKAHGADFGVIVNDWNISLYKDWVKRWLRVTYPNWRIPTQLRDVTGGVGTHRGGRFIDFALLWGRIRSTGFSILKGHEHSDHRGVRLDAVISRRG